MSLMLRSSRQAAPSLSGLASWRAPSQALLRHGAPAWRRRPTAQAPRPAAASADGGIQEQQPPHFSSVRLEEQQQEWQARVQQVAAFQQRHGWVPRRRGRRGQQLVEGELELGRWCTQQRRRKEGSAGQPLSPAEELALRAIPGWIWGEGRRDGGRHPWAQRAQQVAAFVAQHGWLPRRAAGKGAPMQEGEPVLGRWCHQQRQRRKGQGSGAPMSPAEEAELEGIPGWYWGADHQAWEQRVQHVAAFQQEHGWLPRERAGRRRPLRQGEKELGVWCAKQRQRRKGQSSGGPLTTEQEVALEALPGWEWEVNEPWGQRLRQLAAFVEQHGRLPREKGGVKKPLVEGEALLGGWRQTQRQRRKGQGRSGPLTEEQVAMLDSIPIWQW